MTRFLADAIKLQGSFLNAILKRLLVLNSQKDPAVDEDTKKKSHVLFRAIDNVVTRLFFACDFERRFNKAEPEIPLKTRMKSRMGFFLSIKTNAPHSSRQNRS
jgi:hypothetical protein